MTVLAAASCGAVPRVNPPPGLLAVAPVTAGDQARAWADRLQPAPADQLTATCDFPPATVAVSACARGGIGIGRWSHGRLWE